MKYDFLKNFPERMKRVGLYALLMTNSAQKFTWKDFGIESSDQQLVLLFAILLFLMEQSLKEEPCTMDDVATFVMGLNDTSLHLPLSNEESYNLSSFVVNTILSNDGSPMFFQGFDFAKNETVPIRISYIANRIIYTDAGERRTSYYLTDDGYNLLLGTLEVENNLKLSIHEMIFQLHLEKQSYDKALDDVRNIFNLMRIQVQKIQEAMVRIKRNALDYEIAEYRKILEEDLDTIDSTKQKFEGYRKNVQAREQEFRSMDAVHFTKAEEDKLRDLQEIESYLSRAIDEYQRILSSHFDMRALYDSELEKISDMAAVQRFPLRSALFEKVLNDPGILEDLDHVLFPLFVKDPERMFNINRALEPQSVLEEEQEEGEADTDVFDEEAWKREQEEAHRKKMALYENCLTLFFDLLQETGRVTLHDIWKRAQEDTSLLDILIPTPEIFKEIMVELLKSETLDIDALEKERAMYIQEESGSFELSLMVLQILEKHPDWNRIHQVEIYRLDQYTPVVFYDLQTPEGPRTIRCTNVCLKLSGGKES
ncbi:MAG: hypothetical protein LKH04_10240 [Lachnospiraceae bacterium]|jgi:hypothetical protein|nr:hypothetical protein [Lachnospiraceae bacterium]MCI1398477.1 hypothetical protein [Lachnospiraceae bacterium]MCI1424645.1 hypothetical protein [Lachnospiraceae bacterium]MCI1453385.1 hypothetical protein [Lachnospiraceae bacterium]